VGKDAARDLTIEGFGGKEIRYAVQMKGRTVVATAVSESFRRIMLLPMARVSGRNSDDFVEVSSIQIG